MTQKNKIKTAAVLGLGISGKSAVSFLLNQNYQVFGIDDKLDTFEDPFNGKVKLKKNLDFNGIDLLVVSPGVPLSHQMIQCALQEGVEVIGEIELACRHLGRRRCVGVTGTNGKTTVTLLIEHILRQQGLSARAVGNVGLPLTSQLDSTDDVLVIELSSYQLESLTTRCLDLALLLNITPDHLDRYKSMDEYSAAKCRIQDVLKPDGICFVNECVVNPLIKSGIVYGFNPQNKIYYDGKCIVKEGKQVIQLAEDCWSKKTHTVENILAAFCVCDAMGVSSDNFIEAILTFNTPPHRIEFVRKMNEVSYYNDSKGTNVDAVVRAVESMQGNVILIAGGVDKGGAYDVWTSSFA